MKEQALNHPTASSSTLATASDSNYNDPYLYQSEIDGRRSCRTPPAEDGYHSSEEEQYAHKRKKHRIFSQHYHQENYHDFDNNVIERVEREKISFSIVGTVINKSGFIPCCLFRGEVSYGEARWEVQFGQKEVLRLYLSLCCFGIFKRHWCIPKPPLQIWWEKFAKNRQGDREAIEDYVILLIGDEKLLSFEPLLSFLQISPLRIQSQYGPSLIEGYLHMKTNGAEHFPFYKCNSSSFQKLYRLMYKFGMKCAFITCMVVVIIPLFFVLIIGAPLSLVSRSDEVVLPDKSEIKSNSQSAEDILFLLLLMLCTAFIIAYIYKYFARRLGTVRRWVVLKNSCIATFKKRYDKEPSEVFLFDNKFSIEKGGYRQGASWMPSGLVITNKSCMIELDTGVYYTRVTSIVALSISYLLLVYVSGSLLFSFERVQIASAFKSTKTQHPTCGLYFKAPSDMYLKVLEDDAFVLNLSESSDNPNEMKINYVYTFLSSFSNIPAGVALLSDMIPKGAFVGISRYTSTSYNTSDYRALSGSTSQYFDDIGKLVLNGMVSDKGRHQYKSGVLCPVAFEVSPILGNHILWILLILISAGVSMLLFSLLINYLLSCIGFWHAHVRRDHWLNKIKCIQRDIEKPTHGGYRYDSFAPLRGGVFMKKNKDWQEQNDFEVDNDRHLGLDGEVVDSTAGYSSTSTASSSFAAVGSRPQEEEVHTSTTDGSIYIGGGAASFHVDGEDAYDAIYYAIEKAKHEVFIAGWWVCPDLYLHRCNQPSKTRQDYQPVNDEEQDWEQTKLKDVLLRKADEGVIIYLLIYREVNFILTLNSAYTESQLAIHPNIRVHRDPLFQFQDLGFWSHHEKIVCIDQRLAFLGGLDLCFGRFDTSSHHVSEIDTHGPQVWPGKDYSNPLIKDFVNVNNPLQDLIDRNSIPRMPWHDVHVSISGLAAQDVALHFIERWNFVCAKKDYQLRTGWCICCRNFRFKYLKKCIMPMEAYSTRSQQKGRRRKSEDDLKLVQIIVDSPAEDCKAVNKGNVISDSSHSEVAADHILGYMDSGEEEEVDLNKLQPPPHLYWKRLLRNLLRPGLTHIPCRLQIVRSVSKWSAGVPREQSIQTAYIQLIRDAKHFLYIENQFFISGLSGNKVVHNRVLQAIVDRIKRSIDNGDEAFRVYVLMPLLPAFEAKVASEELTNLHAVMHWQFETICRGKNSLFAALKKLTPHPEQYVFFYGLRNYGLMPNGRVATEQVYIHSKLMIVDDNKAIIGSANINDRSMNGSRDSEIAVVIEDVLFEPVDNSNTKKPVISKGKLVAALRRQLFAEHLGICTSDETAAKFSRNSHYHISKPPLTMDQVENVCCRETWDLIRNIAMENTKYFEEIFGCCPANSMRSFNAVSEVADLEHIYENQRFNALKGRHAWSDENNLKENDYAKWTDVNGVPIPISNIDLSHYMVEKNVAKKILPVDNEGWIYARNFAIFQHVRTGQYHQKRKAQKQNNMRTDHDADLLYHNIMLPSTSHGEPLLFVDSNNSNINFTSKREKLEHFMKDRLMAQVRRRRWVKKSLYLDRHEQSQFNDFGDDHNVKADHVDATGASSCSCSFNNEIESMSSLDEALTDTQQPLFTTSTPTLNSMMECQKKANSKCKRKKKRKKRCARVKNGCLSNDEDDDGKMTELDNELGRTLSNVSHGSHNVYEYMATPSSTPSSNGSSQFAEKVSTKVFNSLQVTPPRAVLKQRATQNKVLRSRSYSYAQFSPSSHHDGIGSCHSSRHSAASYRNRKLYGRQSSTTSNTMSRDVFTPVNKFSLHEQSSTLPNTFKRCHSNDNCHQHALSVDNATQQTAGPKMSLDDDNDCQMSHVQTAASVAPAFGDEEDNDLLQYQLSNIQGHLVEFPLEFLADEILKPAILPSNIHI